MVANQKVFNSISPTRRKSTRESYCFMHSQKSDKYMRVLIKNNQDLIRIANSTNKITEGIQNVLLNKLDELENEAKHDGWTYYDNNEVKAIKKTSIEQARRFSEFLDNSISFPSVAPEEDGNICFQWDNQDGVATIFFTEPDKFIYCIVENNTKTEESGTKEFVATNIKTFVNTIKRMGF